MTDVQAIAIGAVRFEPSSQIGIASITTAVPEPLPFSLFTVGGILAFLLKRVRKHIELL